MSDHEELLPDDVPSFDDPAYDDLQARLAEARHQQPIPADVAARLDEVLAGLADEPAPAVPFARRTSIRVLVAAAVLAIIGGAGYGVARGIHDHGTDSMSSAANDAGGSVAAEHGTPKLVPGPRSPMYAPNSATVLHLRSADFTDGASRLLRQSVKRVTRSAPNDFLSNLMDGQAVPSPNPTPPSSDSRAPAATSSGSDNASGNAGSASTAQAACTLPALPGTAAYAITLDGKPATLIVYRPSSGRQLVQAWSCDAKTVLASATLPR